MNDSPALVCIGNITIDESVQPDGSRSEALGGDAIFAALAARLAGMSAALLAPLGADLPEELARQLTDAGLSVDQPRRDLPTVRNIIHYAADGGRRWDMQCSEADFDRLSIHPADVPAWALAAPAILILAMSLASQLKLLPWLRAHSTATIYLDLQEDYVIGNEAALLDIVACCDVFLPSEIEAVRLTGAADAATAARELGRLGPRVVVKRAERGCIIVENGTLTTVPVQAVTAIDPTGAGDAFCGAFAAVHSITGDAVAAAEMGSRIARIAIGAPGVTALLDAVTARAAR